MAREKGLMVLANHDVLVCTERDIPRPPYATTCQLVVKHSVVHNTTSRAQNQLCSDVLISFLPRIGKLTYVVNRPS